MTTPSLVRVGAEHWLHPEWRGKFYPDDLPEDWMLSYYNTQFQAVFLPAQLWQGVSAATWTAWLDETQADFHFVLEPGARPLQALTNSRAILATPEWQARHVWWLDGSPDLRLLAQRIAQHAASAEPLFVFSRGGDLAALEQVATLKQVMGY